MKKRYRPAVFAVVYKKEGKKISYLLLKRKLHWKGWEFAKGGIEKGESQLDAAKREVKEETGLRIVKMGKYNVRGRYPYNLIAKKSRPRYCGQTYSLYSAEVKDGKIRGDGKEHDGFVWVEFGKAIKTLTWPNQRKCLRIVNKSLGN
ncbi:MAG: NUDIX domain-containing protein [Nanoarchaeota archaeon]|nr:NUDIX domain-containing protein [Nanoarchaeota archaeon]